MDNTLSQLSSIIIELKKNGLSHDWFTLTKIEHFNSSIFESLTDKSGLKILFRQTDIKLSQFSYINTIIEEIEITC